jgi:hypothetical protein
MVGVAFFFSRLLTPVSLNEVGPKCSEKTRDLTKIQYDTSGYFVSSNLVNLATTLPVIWDPWLSILL